MAANERSDLKLHLHHAPIEIERKFLIANDAWKHYVVGSVNIRDGLIASYKSRKVRVRISDQIAVITIKGPRHGIARAEYEYEIPLADAELIMSNICGDETLEKQRYFVEHAGTIWHIDVYGGVLNGVVIAEIELKQEDQKFALPPWIGKEVTGNEFYKKINLAAARRATRASTAVQE
jgi:CYTH domain-containing protein